MKDFITILKNGTESLGFNFNDTTFSIFQQYAQLLLETNKNINLTAITDISEIAKLHFLDSLCLLQNFNLTGMKAIDIGCGAGFPSLPLKIALSDFRLTLLDSTLKKIEFLETVTEKLSLNDVEHLHARAEETAHESIHRESYDFAISRAVARLNILSELCLPFLKTSGYFLAYKTTDCDKEIDEAQNAVKFLGGKIERTIDYTIPLTDITHRIVVIQKLHPAPSDYPRRYSKITKQPL